MVLALGPRFATLASTIALNKELMQETRLRLEEDLYGENKERKDERVRELPLSMMVRYDNETLFPTMTSLGARESRGCEGIVEVDVKVAMKEQEE